MGRKCESITRQRARDVGSDGQTNKCDVWTPRTHILPVQLSGTCNASELPATASQPVRPPTWAFDVERTTGHRLCVHSFRLLASATTGGRMKASGVG